ncbi:MULTISPECIES: Photosystem I reaction center subunit IX [Prochlorococcus]|nr:Photosystem I reaction center subunit IX [Prochlorococcus marinus]
MFKIFRTKWFKTAPVVATLWLSSTAVILIGVNYVAPDYLFMPMS